MGAWIGGVAPELTGREVVDSVDGGFEVAVIVVEVASEVASEVAGRVVAVA